jgi:hypothetical protein
MWHLYSQSTVPGESKPSALRSRFARAEYQFLAAVTAPPTYILKGL